VRSTGCTKPWIVAGYSGENDPLMAALSNLRPYNNWLYWLEYSNQLCKTREETTKDTHQFLEQDEECKVIFGCDADETFLEIANLLDCSLDFIERPEKELERYLEAINFDTAKHKENFFKEKIKKYIEVLNRTDFIIIDEEMALSAYLEELRDNPQRQFGNNEELRLIEYFNVAEKLSNLHSTSGISYRDQMINSLTQQLLLNLSLDRKKEIFAKALDIYNFISLEDADEEWIAYLYVNMGQLFFYGGVFIVENQKEYANQSLHYYKLAHDLDTKNKLNILDYESKYHLIDFLLNKDVNMEKLNIETYDKDDVDLLILQNIFPTTNEFNKWYQINFSCLPPNNIVNV
jgi:hypothetical protein